MLVFGERETYSISIKRILFILGGVFCTSKIWDKIKEFQQRKIHKKIEEAASQFHLDRNNRIQALQIPNTSLSQKQIELILNASVTKLKNMLAEKQVKSQDLVNIFSARCQTIGLELFAITEIDYHNAIELAKECDELIEKEGKRAFENKPLLGIPISIKDTFEMKGYACTFGCFSRKDFICKDDGLIVKLIKLSGGIPFVRSNVPQLGMSIETMNRLYGRCLNPWDRSRYPGGSSGGEAALLASRSSPLGIGTDFGGSVRTPACINGICAFKPTNGRVPQKGIGITADTTLGQLAIKTTLGPMGKYVDDIALMLQQFMNTNFLDSLPPSIRGAHTQISPFNYESYNSKKQFKVGYFTTLPYFDSCEAQQRAVREAVNALQNCGHEVVEIQFPFAEELYRIYYEIVSSDNNAKYTDLLGDEDYVSEYALVKYFMTQASAFTRASLRIFLRVIKEKRSSDVMTWCKVNRSAQDFMVINGKLLKLREQVVQYLDELGIQAIISPGLGIPAFEHSTSPLYLICTIYPLIWNVLNFPAGVIPITTIREDEQKYESKICDKISRNIHQAMKRNTKGMPIGVQVSSIPLNDELCLNLMKQIEGKINFYSKVPLPL